MAMHKQFSKRKHWGAFLLCVPLLVKAETAIAPSAEFWQYMLEFSDEQGELMDPEDLAAIENLNNEDAVTADLEKKSTKATKQHSSSEMDINNEQNEANL